MNLSNDQIVALYDKSGISVDKIAELFELPQDVIIMALAGKSSKFREDYKDDECIFPKDTQKLAAAVMSECLHEQDANIRIRAAKFIINEAKGRHDVSNFKNLNVNVNILNDHYSKAMAAIQKSKEQKVVEEQLIEV